MFTGKMALDIRNSTPDWDAVLAPNVDGHDDCDVELELARD